MVLTLLLRTTVSHATDKIPNTTFSRDEMQAQTGLALVLARDASCWTVRLVVVQSLKADDV